MKIAITIPFYNESQFIESTLKSFSALIKEFPQSYFVLIDNNSNDESIKKIEEFNKQYPEIKIVIGKEKRQGVKFARKTALEMTYKLLPDLILSTDADTQLNVNLVNNLADDLRLFLKSKADVFLGKQIINPEINIKRIVYLGKYVSIRRKIWNLHYKIFGPYFFGAFFIIKSGFYSTIRDYYNPESSPLALHGGDYGEDVLFSKRAYYLNGQFQIVRKDFVLTSARRFLHDPYNWVVGKIEGRPRNKDISGVNGLLKNLQKKLEGDESEVDRIIVNNTMDDFWSLFVDAFNFCQDSKFRYKNGEKTLKNFFDYFDIKNNVSDTSISNLNLIRLKKDYLNKAEAKFIKELGL